MKAADITDRAFVEAVDAIQRETGHWAMWNLGMAAVPGIDDRFPGVPHKVLLAKANKVLKRGLVTGCACGCRGDFEVTAKGRELLALDQPLQTH